MAEDKAQRKVELNNPAGGLPAIYANHVAAGMTAFDMRLIFGQITDANPEKVTIDQAVMVTMSWPEIKILHAMLEANIEAFEELNGEIILPQIPPNTLPVPEGLIKRKAK
jgi:hypothetical protein